MASRGELLERWREAGLIDGATVGRIQAYERAREQTGEGGPGVLEVLVYLGAAIVVAGVAVLIGSQWQDFKDWAQAAALAVPALLALGAGQALISLRRPELVRGGHSLWLVATGLAGGAAAVVANNAGAGDSSTALSFGVTGFVAGVALWALAPSPQQVLGVAGPLMLVGVGLGLRADDSGVAIAGGSFVVFGGALLALGELRRFFPKLIVQLCGTAQVAGGAYIASFEFVTMEVVAFAVAGALVAVAIWRRGLVLLAGGVGLFFLSLVASILRHVDNVSAAAALLIVVGVGLVAVVLLIARSRPWQQAHRASEAG
ncbi:MAG: DUF2157 domain-containing protein [Dehalococcoidia bacterium]